MVYVDDMYKTGIGDFGRMKMSHMVADTTEELLQMADKIGVQRKWLQYPGTANEHFDVSSFRRKLAISFGAKEFGFRDYARFVQARCEKHGIHWARASKDLIPDYGREQ